MNVVNLSPVRATDPADLIAGQPDLPDVWERNIEAIRETVRGADLVVAAWGNHGEASDRAARVTEEALSDAPLYCLGITKIGAGTHSMSTI